ncbi:hypothetical protein G6011_02875 [Alternaria panax]|uniref:C2H2-type domain-containing protein n=1 Tax=Alternaria panax TaxID=48097 RepID=A0AAD4FEY8_9PLEO|nr:hypothetical protein G6011_02875 [Alternaria panax]
MASISVAPHFAKDQTAFQPFQCQTCHSRFTRHENLKRHAALHVRSRDGASLICDFCPATFSRSDLRQRHTRRKHPDRQADQRRKQSIEQSREVSTGSFQDMQSAMALVTPEGINDLDIDTAWRTVLHGNKQQHSPVTCHEFGESASSSKTVDTVFLPEDTINDINITLQGILGNEMNPQLEAIHSNSPRSNTPLDSFDLSSLCSPGRWLSAESPKNPEDWNVSTTQITRGIELFFNHLSHFLPFIHRPTFDGHRADGRLLFGMLALGYQYGEDPDDPETVESGASLSLRCFYQARALLKSAANEEELDNSQNITTVQAYLLLQVLTMMYLCGTSSAYGLKIHSKIVALARADGLMKPLPAEAAATADLDSLWHQFIRNETHKRTCFAVHQMDALWYQTLSVPRSLSHLEIKQELPCPNDHWESATSGEWAHKQLLLRQIGPPTQFSEVVKMFLSSSPDLHTLSPFDPYGTININQFLISSAREVSGWSTITGILSTERVEPLRSSLVALEPFARPFGCNSDPVQASLSEVTWETAMIELQMWSPTHTGGIIQGSIDAVLYQLTDDAPSFVKDDNCENMSQHSGIPLEQLLKWNPAVSSDCRNNVWIDSAYCARVETSNLMPTTSMHATSISGPTCSSKTLANQTMICNAWHRVASGDKCKTLLNMFRLKSVEEFLR